MASINELLRDEMIAHKVNITQYESSFISNIEKLLKESDKALSAQLIISLSDMNDGFRISWLLNELSSVKTIGGFSDALANELLGFAKYESEYHYSLFESLLSDAVLNKYKLFGVTPQQVYSAATATPFQGRLLSEWVTNIEDDRLNRVANAVRIGYLNGETIDQIIKKVRGTKSNNFRDGILDITRRNTGALVKSAVSHFSETARDSFTNSNKDLFKGKQWLSTLDTSTTNTCIIRDKKQYDLDNKPIGHKIPWGDGPGKIHFCCRSVYTWILKSWRELGINKDEMTVGTRASMDGQVPKDTTYLEWLRKQSESRQLEILGETRFKLMTVSGVEPSKFYTDTGQFRSLDELRKIDEEAFERIKQ